MGFMSSLERGLERAVNSAFARTFKSGVQPVEIAAAIKREMDVNSYVVDRDRVLAPNQFTIQMSQADSKIYSLRINSFSLFIKKYAN